MANITQRNNSYLIRCSAGYDIHGKQIVRSMTWKIPDNMSEKKADKEVQHQAALFEESVKNETVLDNKIKFADYIDKWLKDYADPNLKARTVSGYKDYAKRVKEIIGHVRMDKIKPTTLIKFYQELQKPVNTSVYIYDGDFKGYVKNLDLTQQGFANKYSFTQYELRKLASGKPINERVAIKFCNVMNLDIKNTFIKRTSTNYLSNKTIQNYHRLISSMLSTAVNWQIIVSNPAERVSVPKVKKQEALYLDEEDVLKMLRALENESLICQAAIKTLLFTGMRRGELIGLKWSDVDFKNYLISISKSILYLPDKGVFEDTTKTNSSTRTIKAPQEVFTTLKKWKTVQSAARSELESTWHDEDWIFTRWNGEAMRPDYLTHWFHKFIRKNNLPPIHLHNLRHTNASLLIANGTNIQTVASRLGHASTSTTSNIYSHAIRSADALASETLDVLLKSKE